MLTSSISVWDLKMQSLLHKKNKTHGNVFPVDVTSKKMGANAGQKDVNIIIFYFYFL